MAGYIHAGLQNTWKGLFEDGVVEEGEDDQARVVMDEIIAAVKEVGERPPNYDPDFGDDKLCVCEHEYHRHFDSYENMSPVGCKYCQCEKFKDPVTGAGAPEGPAREPYAEVAEDDWPDDPIGPGDGD